MVSIQANKKFNYVFAFYIIISGFFIALTAK